MDEQIFILTNDAGEEQRCRVVFNFETDEHSYVLFTLVDENGESISDVTALRYESDESGEDIVCEVLHRFEKNGKKYLFYGLADDEEKTEVFASAYEADENGAVADLIPIETEEEWAMVEEVLASLAVEQ